jgi:DNA-binding GntR family transcriptional regulator
MVNHSPSQAIDSIQKRPLKEDIFDSLVEKIISGQYKPGDWLRQEDIASQLDVSMTPVREALDLLSAAGLAERVPYRGVRVPEPTVQEIAESYAMRLLLEKSISRAAALNREQAHIDELKRIVGQARKLISLDDLSASRELSGDFHFTVVEAAQNSILTRVYKMVVNTFPDCMVYQAMFEHPEALEQSIKEEYEEHLAIADAIEARDADLAGQRAMEHILDIGKQIVLYLGVPQELLNEKTAQLGL